jgi:hypothetical protein
LLPGKSKPGQLTKGLKEPGMVHECHQLAFLLLLICAVKSTV